MSSAPLPTSVKVFPTPELLVGFRTLEEAQETQALILAAPEVDVLAKLKELGERSRLGEVVTITPEKPEPPVERWGHTIWQVGGFACKSNNK